MTKKLSKLEMAQQKAEAAAQSTNKKINDLGLCASDLYAALTGIQSQFDQIRNEPEENRIRYEHLKQIRMTWRKQAENIELEYKKAEVRAAGQGAAGVGAGVAVAALGGSDQRQHNGRCNGDCANCPPHYGYRYGRWYYGHDHVYGCEFGGNRGSGSSG